MERRMARDLDRYITGNYGEKQMELPSHTCVDRPHLPCDACGNKHTPGPWVSRPTAGHDIHGQSVVYPETDGKDIAIVYDGDANASLIAAAPEMLEALERISDIDPEGVECASRNRFKPTGCGCIGCVARAAIRKARGEQ